MASVLAPPLLVLMYRVSSLVYMQVMDVINDEEKQFLKTLSRGKRLFERTVARMESSVIPGN